MNIKDLAILKAISKGNNVSTPDWNQNDASAPEYIANRPCYEGEEKDLVYTWDGDIKGRYIVDLGNGEQMVHISNDELFVDNLQNGGTLSITTVNANTENTIQTNEIAMSDCFAYGDGGFKVAGTVYYIPYDNYKTDIDDIVFNFNKSGIYFYLKNIAPYEYVNELRLNKTRIIKKINSKYIPDNIKIGMNTTGKEFSLGEADPQFIKNSKVIKKYVGKANAEVFNNYTDNAAIGYSSHAEGEGTTAIGNSSHAEGESTTASGDTSHAEGFYTVSSNISSHAEGSNTKAIGNYSHAEGFLAIASGYNSHAEGSNTKAIGNGSHAEGYGTKASGHSSHIQGKYNIEDTEEKYAHIVGNGNKDTVRSNAHTLDWQGNASFAGAVTSVGADYAEYFEWEDGNPNNEDRVGLLVTLKNDKICIANNGDDVLGIVSGTAMVIGDNAEWEWTNKYMTDEYGRVIWTKEECFIETINPETGEEEKESIGFFPCRKINPDFDKNKEYVCRSDRKEWDTIGLIGKLHLHDDGSCAIGGYATAGANGIATKSETKTNMKVMRRINDHVVVVLMR